MANNTYTISAEERDQQVLEKRDKLIEDVMGTEEEIKNLKSAETEKRVPKMSYEDALRINAFNNKISDVLINGSYDFDDETGDIIYYADKNRTKRLPEDQDRLIRNSNTKLQELSDKYGVGLDLLSKSAETVLGNIGDSLKRRAQITNNFKNYYNDMLRVSRGEDLETVQLERLKAIEGKSSELDKEYLNRIKGEEEDNTGAILSNMAVQAASFIAGTVVSKDPTLAARGALAASEENARRMEEKRKEISAIQKDLYNKYQDLKFKYTKEYDDQFNKYIDDIKALRKESATEALKLVEKDIQDDIDRSKELIKKDISTYAQLVGAGYLDKDDAKNQIEFLKNKAIAQTNILRAVTNAAKYKKSGGGGAGKKDKDKEKSEPAQNPVTGGNVSGARLYESEKDAINNKIEEILNTDINAEFDESNFSNFKSDVESMKRAFNDYKKTVITEEESRQKDIRKEDEAKSRDLYKEFSDLQSLGDKKKILFKGFPERYIENLPDEDVLQLMRLVSAENIYPIIKHFRTHKNLKLTIQKFTIK